MESGEKLEQKARQSSLYDAVVDEVERYIDELLKDPKWKRKASEPT